MVITCVIMIGSNVWSYICMSVYWINPWHLWGCLEARVSRWSSIDHWYLMISRVGWLLMSLESLSFRCTLQMIVNAYMLLIINSFLFSEGTCQITISYNKRRNNTSGERDAMSVPSFSKQPEARRRQLSLVKPSATRTCFEGPFPARVRRRRECCNQSLNGWRKLEFVPP